ncbi:MAG: phytanoyl-CoA dioxygenase family protein [Pseudomonadales bacterium]|jgi:chlorinating enzyme|nr:phytanoyl-CoA dioxygenase family protein [Pseudomonadales bacterium]MDP6470467.1 phytanoyl-CoA dioxygenase family protein [Pseudomonadales bacterium]MDP6827769.1 phytanoyl-CoA dioxygenase family protein [Pseudomonadales bacterium]MDP6973411.1 phytanoyl-CoA dioxygenase family protein [Pseudomonadales bacterium]
MSLTPEQVEAFYEDGFVVIRKCVPPDEAASLLVAANAIADAAQRDDDTGDALLQPESALAGETGPLRTRLSKIFRIHRTEATFRAVATGPELVTRVQSLMGDNLDCFLSQFIYKMPGALGQPWHQDSFYFPFDGPHQVGAWLAVTQAHSDNGPLWVLPGSHTEPVHEAVKDTREHANHGYYEIVDHDMSAAVPVLMQPGDMLLFHSHLMHKSTDNVSKELRAAMVYHFATSDTIDRSEQKYGRKPPNQDWMPILRYGQLTHRD